MSPPSNTDPARSCFGKRRYSTEHDEDEEDEMSEENKYWVTRVERAGARIAELESAGDELDSSLGHTIDEREAHEERALAGDDDFDITRSP